MAGVHGMILATHAGAFDYIDGLPATLLNTTMTVGSSYADIEEGDYSWNYGTGTINGIWAKNISSRRVFLYGYDGGGDIYQDYFTWATNQPTVYWIDQNPDTMGSVGSTEVDGDEHTLLYLYRTHQNELYLGFVGTADVSFTSLSVNGNTFARADAYTSNYEGNRYYLWNSADGVTSSTIPTSGSINVTITG